jgi:hypothetical protein
MGIFKLPTSGLLPQKIKNNVGAIQKDSRSFLFIKDNGAGIAFSKEDLEKMNLRAGKEGKGITRAEKLATSEQGSAVAIRRIDHNGTPYIVAFDAGDDCGRLGSRLSASGNLTFGVNHTGSELWLPDRANFENYLDDLFKVSHKVRDYYEKVHKARLEAKKSRQEIRAERGEISMNSKKTSKRLYFHVELNDEPVFVIKLDEYGNKYEAEVPVGVLLPYYSETEYLNHSI